MKINYFEEFPSKKNLHRTKATKQGEILFLAARSLKEFEILKEKINKINKKIDIAYWPILKESYWISPFSKPEELKNLYAQLKDRKNKKKLKILLDLELPLLKKKLFLKNLGNFSKNKKLINKIFEDAEKLKLEIYTAEYPVPGKFIGGILRILGISPKDKNKKTSRIMMFYSSMIKNRWILNKMKKHISKESMRRNGQMNLGLGTIAKGILGNEPKLTPKKLEQDLKFCKDCGITEVTIFGLEGLNSEYLKIINKYQ